MRVIGVFILLPLVFTVIIPFVNFRGKGIIMLSAIIINAFLSSYYAINTLFGQTFEFILPGSLISGLVPIRIDSLSGWFMLIINFVFITGSFYGIFYMNSYKKQNNSLSLHAIALIILHSALLGLCVIQNSLVFLIFWELMALSAFILVIFDHKKTATIKAGINYLIQSHVSIVFLMLGFIWAAIDQNSFDFNKIKIFASENHGRAMVLFLLFFIGFAIKAGFVPFHTWLPYAHPAAPAHISGIMSGVIIKIGIFGILRMLLLIKPDYTIIGYLILFISVISGLYGVMLAIIQHNLKKLLAYHSIENIGIIGIGIGMGCIGMGSGNQMLTTLGFAGALLHTLNHGLFKSLLFYTAGNVYQSTHTLNIESLGGLVKKMPQTAFLFLIAAIAISGIPPFNGFVSEFLIYNGLYSWLHDATLAALISIVFSILSLVLIGGLALLCFTKAFGIVFLGNPRQQFQHEIKEVSLFQLIPLYLIAFFIAFIGLFPDLFLNVLNYPVSLFTETLDMNFKPFNTVVAIRSISQTMWILILVVILVFSVRRFITRKKSIVTLTTWGCGYVGLASKTQYTANSFIRPYRKLFKPFLLIFKHKKDVEGIFPGTSQYESHSYDKIEMWLIDSPIRALKSFVGRFTFLQNGRLQFYILYGIAFIVSVICIPVIYKAIIEFIDFLKQL